VKPATSKGGREKAFIFVPKKLAIKNYLVETGTSDFENQNIQNMKYSHYRKNQTPWFGKLNYLIFLGSAGCVVYEAIVFHSSNSDFRLCEN
jgi:hypothetical protein